MALWPPGFDPFMDPFAQLGGGGYGPLTGSVFYDPLYVPGGGAATRRRLNAPTGAGAGAGAAGAGETGGGGGGEEGRRTRDPFVVGSAGWTRSIPCDFIEREQEYVVRADIPGCHKSEIHVEVHDGNVLRFGHNPNAEREKEDVEETGVFHRAERVTSFRNRNLRMPDDADMAAELRANYEDGVLQVIIPKKAGQRTPGRSIEIV